MCVYLQESQLEDSMSREHVLLRQYSGTHSGMNLRSSDHTDSLDIHDKRTPNYLQNIYNNNTKYQIIIELIR